jgi:hypothetical protein
MQFVGSTFRSAARRANRSAVGRSAAICLICTLGLAIVGFANRAAAQAALEDRTASENCVVLVLDRAMGTTTVAPCAEAHTSFRQGEQAGRQDLAPLVTGRTAAVTRSDNAATLAAASRAPAEKED